MATSVLDLKQHDKHAQLTFRDTPSTSLVMQQDTSRIGLPLLSSLTANHWEIVKRKFHMYWLAVYGPLFWIVAAFVCWWDTQHPKKTSWAQHDNNRLYSGCAQNCYESVPNRRNHVEKTLGKAANLTPVRLLEEPMCIDQGQGHGHNRSPHYSPTKTRIFQQTCKKKLDDLKRMLKRERQARTRRDDAPLPRCRSSRIVPKVLRKAFGSVRNDAGHHNGWSDEQAAPHSSLPSLGLSLSLPIPVPHRQSVAAGTSTASLPERSLCASRLSHFRQRAVSDSKRNSR